MSAVNTLKIHLQLAKRKTVYQHSNNNIIEMIYHL